MGCGTNNTRIYVTSVIFWVIIENPYTKGLNTFYWPSEFSEVLLPALMNSVAFDSRNEGQIDANFISKYNDAAGDFDYYVQRLLGVDMENEETPEKGKIWAPFINGKREDWTFICRNNRIVSKKDRIVWKFVPFEEELHESQKDKVVA